MPNEKRRSKWERDTDNLPKWQLQPRDLEIVRAVHAFRFLSTDQACALFFTPKAISRCRTRLRYLFHHGYLHRFPAVICEKGKDPQKISIYRLGREGAKFLAQEQERPLKEYPYWGKHDDEKDRGMTQPSPLFTQHELLIHDARIAILKAAAAHGYAVTQWIDSSVLKSPKHKDRVTIKDDEGNEKKPAILPDAYFVLSLSEEDESSFFLELDHGTEKMKDWRAKIRAYAAYTKPQGKDKDKKPLPSLYEKRYQTLSLRILTITTIESRLQLLKKTTEDEGGKSRYWFTTVDQVTPEKVLTAPIWIRAGEQTHQPLISPKASANDPDT